MDTTTKELKTPTEGDILIAIKTEIRAQEETAVLVYDAVDRKHGLPAGSTEKYLEKAAHKANYEVVNKGAIRAELRPRLPALFA